MRVTSSSADPRAHGFFAFRLGASAWLRRRLLGIALREVTFARRGFHAADPAIRARLEGSGLAFRRGYHAALEWTSPAALSAALDAEPSVMRGFGYEGAGMALALLDALVPWGRGRLDVFLRGPGGAHVYMVNVGAGWALARLRRRLDSPPAGLDPLLGWLAVDGYGFHEGYFHPVRTTEHAVPRRLGGYARRVFDQGLGRSLWFSRGADPERVAAAVRWIGADRAADLWAGVGLACAYAGGATEDAMGVLLRAAGPDRGWLAQGAAFAAKARQRAGNPAPHTDAACRALAGVSADEAADATDQALSALEANPSPDAYERWRTGVYRRLGRGAG